MYLTILVSSALQFCFVLFLLDFALVLGLHKMDCEPLIFFRKLFVNNLWGLGWWWVLPVGIYFCFDCMSGNTTSSCLFFFFGSSRLCESGLWIHMRIGLSLQLIRGLPLLYYRLLGVGAVGFVFDLSFHQGFILIPVLWGLNSLLDPPRTYPEAMAATVESGRGCQTLSVSHSFLVPIFTKILAE